METVQQFGPNVVGFHLATGERRCYIVGCYLAPDDTLTIENDVAALKELPRGAELLVAGDFNVKLSELEGDRRREDIAAALATEGGHPVVRAQHYRLPAGDRESAVVHRGMLP